MLRLVLILLLLLLLIGSLPTWGYSAGWGYYPSGGLGVVLLVVIHSGFNEPRSANDLVSYF